MRRARLSIILSVAATAATLHAQVLPNRQTSDLNRRGTSVERLHAWVESVRLHEAGNVDEPLARIAQWTSPQLDDLWIEVQSLHELMENPRHNNAFQIWIDSPRGGFSARIAYSGSELDRLRRLALSLGGRDQRTVSTPDYDRQVLAARNRMLMRGAVLHTDVALTNPRDVQTGPISPFAPARPDANILFADGRQVGVDRAANQWTLARALLGRVLPSASADEGVRAWYRASSAVLLGKMHLRSEHFDEALRLFPDDSVLTMLRGGLHEAFASSDVQEFVRSATPPPGIKLRVGSTRTELGRAEALFKRSLSIDPGNAEARLRLGRVLSLQERHADALNELRRMDASAPEILQYYASLFIGDAAEALERIDEARAAYERAATLSPDAHAPRLALSHLAARAGNTLAASQTLELVLSRTPDAAQDEDPFWSYYVAIGRDAKALLEEAYRLLTREATP